MRNLKKLLAVIVSVCVLATFALPAFAAETTTLTDAQISEKLGAVKGDTSQGVTEEYLAKGTTRLQAAIIYLRMLNLEEEALAFESEDNFADAADVPWAGGRAILAYLKANPELGWQGVSETTFEPNGAASAQMMYKVALEALGYKQGTDFEWADVFTFAADKGLGKAADLAELTNNDMCTIVVEMLGIKVKDGDVTLIEKLVADGVVTEEAAVATGLVAAGEALDVSGAVAINSKIVEVTLENAATAKDVAAATFAVKDSAGKAIDVTGAEFAPWSADGKSILVTLGADTAVGTLYTLTVGDKNFNFGGKPVDTAKPTATIASTDYNEVTITFSEAVKIETAKVSVAKAYGDKAALELSDVRYDGSSKLVYTTADQADATLYKAVIENTADLAGNVMDKAEPTFVGNAKPTGDQEVVAAKALDYKTIYVEFKINVDSATVAAENFTLAEAYGDKAVIAIAEANMATTTQAGKYNTSYNDDAKKAAAKKAVVLTLSGEVKDATLYKVTAKNVSTLYGKALSSTEAKTYTTFTGKSKPGADSLTYTATATSNTEVKLTFANDLDEATAENIANYAIAKAYGDKAALEVTKAELSDGNIVKLTVGTMAIDMYKVTATGIMDIYGNSIKTSSDANIQSFAGKAVDSKIDGFSVQDIVGSTGKIRVDFNRNYGEGALDVASYFIDKGIGYPSKVEKVSGSTTAVDLVIPKTEIGTLYTITVKNVKNSDGVAMDADGVTKTFVGNDEAPGAAKLEAAYAVDSKTIRLYFNKNVEDISVLDRSSASLLASEMAISGGAGSSASVVISHAYVDPADKKVIIAYTTNADFKDGGSDDVFTVTVADLSSDYNSKTFAENTNDAAKIKVDGVVAVNDKTLTIYFNQPVRYLQNGFAAVTKADGTAHANITNLRATNDSKTIWEAKLDTALTGTEYKLVLASYDNTVISNIDTGVDLNVLDDTLTYTFAGNATEELYVKDVYAVGIDTRTIRVYFPEAMNKTHIENVSNYTVVDGNGTDVTAGKIVAAKAESDAKVVTLITNGNFDASTTGYFMKVANTVENALGTKTVKTDATTDLKKEFALGTASPAKVTVKKVTVSGQEITVELSQPAASSANYVGSAANLIADFTIRVNDQATTLGAANIKTVAAKLGSSAAADTTVGFDKLIITVLPTGEDPTDGIDLVVNKAGDIDFTSGAGITGVNGEPEDGDMSAVVFVQK